MTVKELKDVAHGRRDDEQVFLKVDTPEGTIFYNVRTAICPGYALVIVAGDYAEKGAVEDPGTDLKW